MNIECADISDEKMACGHPSGCIVSTPYIAGVASSMYCGWCASEMRAKGMEEECDKLREQIAAALEVAQDVNDDE